MTTEDALIELARSAEHLTDLRATVDDLLGNEWSPARSRELLDTDGPTWAVELWKQLRGLGWADMLVDGSVADMCAVAESVGMSTAPIPFVTTAVATWATGRRDTVEPGTVIVPGAFAATQVANGFELSGQQPFVPYADVAGQLLVHAHEDNGTELLLALEAGTEGVERVSLRPLDVMPSAAVNLRGVRATHDDVVAKGPAAAARAAEAQLRLTLGWSAELTGVAAAANAAAAEYACERVAFGRPIGSFQAIKHRLVDQRAAIEVSRALVGRAALAVDSAGADRAALVALAAFWAGDALRSVAEGAIQVFGGIGYTWEHTAHIFLRRAAVLVALLGDRGTHRDVVAQWLRSR